MHPLAPREFRLCADASELYTARRHVDDAARAFGLGATERYQFVCAVNEAVTNAIRYGEPDSQGQIGLRIESAGDSLVCSVRDSGRFPLSVPTSDPMAPHGRGFTLMHLLADDIELEAMPDGTTVRLCKARVTGSVGTRV